LNTCPICGDELLPLFSKNGFLIGECRECKTLAVMDLVNPDDLKIIYSADYYEKHQSRYIKVSSKDRALWMRRLKVIEGIVESAGLKKRLMDVGCGTGIFITIAQSHGWDVSGIEISTGGRAIAAKAVGANRIYDDLFTIDEEEGFDVVTMWAIIEHLPDPLAYLDKAYSLLKPGGVLALATMNTDCWNRKLFGDRWRYFTPPEHLVFFNKENLRSALEKTGFEMTAMTAHFNELSFWQSAPLPYLNSSSSLLARIARKAFVAPIRVASDWLQTGDIIELYAQRV